jgi:predicted enzyme related to lactoylglutathione lyase
MPAQSPLTLANVRLLVRDFGAAFRFWRDTVGLAVVYGDEDGPYAEFDTGSTPLALYSATAMSEQTGIEVGRGGRGADDILIDLEVGDVDAAARELESRGVQFVTPPTSRPRWGIRAAHFRDTEGNLFEIYADLPEGAA